MISYTVAASNDTVSLSSVVNQDLVWDLPDTVTLVNGQATVMPRFMQPGLTYTIHAQDQTNPSILEGYSLPIACNAGVSADKPYLLLSHRSLAPVTVAQEESDLPVLQFLLTNPNDMGSALYNLRGVTLTVQDNHGQKLPVGDFVSQVSIRDTQTGNVLVTANSTAGQDDVYAPLAYEDLLIEPGTTKNITVEINMSPNARQQFFKIGIALNTQVDCQFTNNTPMLVTANPPDTFPMMSGLMAVSSRQLEASFINYPNPFAAGRGHTEIEYYLENDSEVSLKIYNITGQLVRTLVDKEMQAGSTRLHRYQWDGCNGQGNVVLNGVYFAVLKVNPASGASKQMVLKIAVIK